MNNKIILPRLEKRGQFWEYRLRVSGGRKRFSTGKENYEDARKVLEAVIEKHNLVKSETIDKKAKEKILNVFYEETSIEKRPVINIEDAWSEWVRHYPRFCDLDDGTKEFYHSIFMKFINWAFSEGITHVDRITNKVALEYASYLWNNEDEPISAKTYNHHIVHLSQIFSTLDAVYHLSERNPFNSKIVHRKRKSELNTASHLPLEPAMLQKVLTEAATHGRGIRDLFILGSNTGLRLEDACCLKWECIGKDFIETIPGKTRRTGNRARIPLSSALRVLIKERAKSQDSSGFFIPEIAQHYIRNDDCIKKTCSRIFEAALGDDISKVPAGEHRKRDTNVYSFHSFRTTFMSLLASKDVSVRDAMRIMAWESAEMIKVYENELEKARGDADARALDMINSIDELKNELPALPEPKLKPTFEALGQLVTKYSNATIGQIYGMTEAGVRKWLAKFGIERKKRIESILSEKDIEEVRKELVG